MELNLGFVAEFLRASAADVCTPSSESLSNGIKLGIAASLISDSMTIDLGDRHAPFFRSPFGKTAAPSSGLTILLIWAGNWCGLNCHSTMTRIMALRGVDSRVAR